MARDHRKLDAFHLADGFVVAIYQATTDFPSTERFGLASQLRRAAVSIPTNIIEGCARDSQPEYLRFLEIAFGSAREVLYLIELSEKLQILKKESASELHTSGRRTCAALAALRSSVGRAAAKPLSPQVPKPLSP